MLKPLTKYPYLPRFEKASSKPGFLHYCLLIVGGINKFLFCTSLLIVVISPCAKAQDEINYAVYANIIYRFTKYIDWPDDKKSGDFVIGIVGKSPVYNELISFTANKMVGNQKIVIKKMSSS